MAFKRKLGWASICVGLVLFVAETAGSQPLLAQERREDVDAALILGPAIAHEIGHLLMPSRKHTRAGVLTGEWRKEQLRLPAGGQMVFTAEECKEIREDVALRTRELGASRDFPP